MRNHEKHKTSFLRETKNSKPRQTKFAFVKPQHGEWRGIANSLTNTNTWLFSPLFYYNDTLFRVVVMFWLLQKIKTRISENDCVRGVPRYAPFCKRFAVLQLFVYAVIRVSWGIYVQNLTLQATDTSVYWWKLLRQSYADTSSLCFTSRNVDCFYCLFHVQKV